jgi:hypothetical protein
MQTQLHGGGLHGGRLKYTLFRLCGKMKWFDMQLMEIGGSWGWIQARKYGVTFNSK